MKIFGREPAMWLTAIAALVTFALDMGWLPVEASDSILAFVEAVIVLITGVAIRQGVVSVKKLKEEGITKVGPTVLLALFLLVPGAAPNPLDAQTQDSASVNVLPTIAHVEVLPASSDIGVGDTIQFSAISFDRGGATVPGVTYDFFSTDPSVIAVDVVTGEGVALAPGSAQVFVVVTSPFVVGVNDLRVLDCGDVWCDLAWTHAGPADAYAVFALTSQGVPIDSLDVPLALSMTASIADTTTWEVLDAGQVVGTLRMTAVRSGTCQWPVMASAGRVACRASGLTPATDYRWLVRPARIGE